MNISVYNVHDMNENNREESVTLEILQAIDEKDNVTQRHLSERLGVALGLTNSYLKRCARKGYIKVQQAPANRYLYYLTPKGFSEKSRLTAKYLSASFGFYRKAGDSYRALFSIAKDNQWQNLLFCGASELAEIASIQLFEFDLSHIATFDDRRSLNSYLGKPVWHALDKKQDVDAYLITSLDDFERIYKLVRTSVDEQRILIPDFLSI